MDKASKSDRLTSNEEPTTSDHNLKKRKSSTESVTPKKFVDSPSTSTSNRPDLLCNEIIGRVEDSFNCVPSNELRIIPSTSIASVSQNTLDNTFSASTSNIQNMEITSSTQQKEGFFLEFLKENWNMLIGDDATAQCSSEEQTSDDEPDTGDSDLNKNKPSTSASQENVDTLSSESTVEEDSPDSDYASSEEAEETQLTPITPSTSTTSTSVTQPEALKNPSLWRLLRRYGRKLRNEIELGNLNYHSVQDYIEQISNLINSEKSVDSGWYFVNDYQIVTQDGKIWFQDEIENIAKANLQKNSDNKSLCRFEECKDCSYKSIPASEEKVIQHIIRSTGALYYCVPCGEVYRHWYGICHHAQSCPYRFTMAEHNDVRWRDVKPLMKREKPLAAGKVLIDDFQTRDYKAEYNELISNLLTNIQRDGLLNDKTIEELMDSIKDDIDYDFVSLFEKIHKKTLSKKIFKVYRKDNYYTIFYPSSNQKDSSKSVMFRIIEVVTKKVRSLSRLEAVRDYTLSFEDMKCHYEYCKCKQSYVNPDPVFLVGHILAENFLIACVGCETGFIDFSDFEKHFNDDCYIQRKPYSPKCRKIM